MSSIIDASAAEVANQKEALLPTLKVTWNADEQAANVAFKPEEFKSWDFVVMCLEEGLRKAKLTRDLMTQAAMQKQMLDHAQSQQLAHQLQANGNLRRR